MKTEEIRMKNAHRRSTALTRLMERREPSKGMSTPAAARCTAKACSWATRPDVIAEWSTLISGCLTERADEMGGGWYVSQQKKWLANQHDRKLEKQRVAYLLGPGSKECCFSVALLRGWLSMVRKRTKKNS